ncbi:unnamed protein product [Larinioides sclopetarius]|uniref:Uncharacterized protein n=1 Tax=Larinioides sclopetarius TaxID=280406 RepID=A0AAV1YWT1_9ARAC
MELKCVIGFYYSWPFCAGDIADFLLVKVEFAFGVNLQWIKSVLEFEASNQFSCCQFNRNKFCAADEIFFSSENFGIPITIAPHKSMNACHGVISESDLFTPEYLILEGLSDQSVTNVDAVPITTHESTSTTVTVATGSTIEVSNAEPMQVEVFPYTILVLKLYHLPVKMQFTMAL